MNQKDTKPSFVAYLRVSTARQGKSGLGIEAQREAVSRFVAERAGKIIAPEFVEVESGKRNDRPELDKAIKRCRLTGATLVVAKLDRLSRNAAFLMTLRDSGASFVAADLPEANAMTVGVMAVVAQHEREAISARTKAALAAARARGTVLGGLRPKAPDISRFQKQAVRAVQEKALAIAEDRRDVIEALVSEGLSMNAIAGRLNEASVKTSRGKDWTAMAVKRTMERLEIERA
ncbi:MAG TPA: recombinase family protein [Rhizomicrobium sp.]|nr:recombinase family protein [Rhizomicrobium sp.]